MRAQDAGGTTGLCSAIRHSHTYRSAPVQASSPVRAVGAQEQVDGGGDMALHVGRRQRLGAEGAVNVSFETADAFAWQPGRLFDAIAVTGSVAADPDYFAQWLKPGGRLFVVHGLSPVQEALRVTRRGDALLRESLFETDLPYLHGAAPVPRFVL